MQLVMRRFRSNLKSNEEALEVIVEAITKAGYKPGEGFSGFRRCCDRAFKDGKYYLEGEGLTMSAEMVNFYDKLCSKYPVISIEDGLAEDDWVAGRR